MASFHLLFFSIHQETDWEATNEAIEEQVARESYLQWLQVGERKIRLGGLFNDFVWLKLLTSSFSWYA